MATSTWKFGGYWPVPGWRLSALDRHRPPITAIGWCLNVCNKKNTNASRRQEFFSSLDRVFGTLCLSHYVAKISHLNSFRDFWRHFGLYMAAAHSDCCFLRRVQIFLYLLTYLLTSLQNANFQSIFFRSASAVTPGKKIQVTLIGSPLRAIQCTSVRRLAVAKRPCECSYSIFARSASAVPASEKKFN